MIETLKDITRSIETNIVGCLWQKPELYTEHDELSSKHFHNDVWKIYFALGKDIVKTGKFSLDEITVGLHASQNELFAEKYEEYGGYDVVEELIGYSRIENLEGYIADLTKWNVVIKLAQKNFPIKNMIDEFRKMTAEQIYEYYEAQINDVFIGVDTNIKSHNLCEGLDNLIEEANEGRDIGMPILSEELNDEIGGAIDGQISLVGGLSGAGKSTLTAELMVAACIEHEERLVIMINEEDEKKWKKDMILWIANNKLGGNFGKKRWREGNFNKEEMALLKKAAKELEVYKDKKLITVIPLPSYTVGLAIKIIKKYSALGVKKFVLDTFKAGYDSKDDAMWLSMMQDMRKLYDVIKPSQKNVHLWVTLQLNKGSIKQRYMTADNIGMAKNVIDVASVCLLTRRVRDDEMPEGVNELKVWRKVPGVKNPIPVELDPKKMYVLIFIEKNRNGSSQEYQIVAENNLGTNVYKEVGFTHVPRDF